MSHVALVILFSILLLPGLFTVLIPMLPSLSYMLFAAGIFGLIDNFIHFSLYELGVLAAIFVLSLIVDQLAGILGAKYLGGASKRSMIAGFIGLIIGFILLPPFGGFLGLFAGVLISEFIYERKSGFVALKAARGTLLGALTGVLVNECLAIIFLALFIVFASV